MKVLFCIVFFFGLSGFNFAQIDNNTDQPIKNKKLCLIQPVDSLIDNIPVMTIIADTSNIYTSAIGIITQSIVKEFINLHYNVQLYLKNTGQIQNIEPAYLALTENQGGYARKGFYLRMKDSVISKKESYYVDIKESNIQSAQNHLMSFSQLYPHELGHVLYRLLSSDTSKPQSKSVDMHYFSIITDYSTAFNEGFAEHLENIARLYEPDSSIKHGIEKDVERIRIDSKRKLLRSKMIINIRFV